jgi:hypothetical protein
MGSANEIGHAYANCMVDELTMPAGRREVSMQATVTELTIT